MPLQHSSPYSFLPTQREEYARDLFLVLAVSLLVSWVLALVQVPFFAKLFFKKRDGTEVNPKDKSAEDEVLYDGVFYRIIRNAVTWITSHRIISASAFVVALQEVYFVLGLSKISFSLISITNSL